MGDGDLWQSAGGNRDGRCGAGQVGMCGLSGCEWLV
jgi:hypothetical protein